MPVPNTDSFSLSDVRTELGLGSTTSLSACIAAAVTTAYDPDYFTAPATSLLEFRNYDAIPRWWTLTPCAGGTTAYTRLDPLGVANKRYILPTGSVNYTWGGGFLDQASTPSGYDGSIQRTALTGCP